MTRQLVYLSGEPGVGKSTLMARVTACWDGSAQPPSPVAPARILYATPGTQGLEPVAIELGRHRDAFSGTDALPSAVITCAEEYVRSGLAAAEAPLLLAEGARLANVRFLTAAVQSGYTVTLFHLHGADLAARRRNQRALHLGKAEQNPAWVKGRRTAAINLAETAPSLGVKLVAVSAERIVVDADYLSVIVAAMRGTTAPPVLSPP